MIDSPLEVIGGEGRLPRHNPSMYQLIRRQEETRHARKFEQRRAAFQSRVMGFGLFPLPGAWGVGPRSAFSSAGAERGEGSRGNVAGSSFWFLTRVY
jgi:hypothetical protein